MTAETASNTAAARRRRNVLDLPRVVFQGIAPSINVVLTFPIIALAGYLPPCWLAPGPAMRRR